MSKSNSTISTPQLEPQNGHSCQTERTYQLQKRQDQISGAEAITRDEV